MTKGLERRLAALLAVISTSLVVLTIPAASQQPTSAQRNAIREECRSDYEAHCASVPTGGKPALMCLQKNMASLSASCQTAVSAIDKPSVATPAAAAPASAPKAAATPAAAAPKAATAAAPKQQPSQAQTDTIRQVCRSDYEANCASIPPGGAAALSCLQTNSAKLSQPCQQAVSAVGGAPAAAGSAASTASPAPTTVGAAPVVPMRAISPRREIMLVRSACGGDFRTYCSNVPLGGGRAVECLRANAASLSPTCQSAMLGLR
ncbi:MAG: hypothetical protein JWP84_994 [Tardiphaga sp.]|nr:hypothetical protein [Tardiphaga sp.]